MNKIRLRLAPSPTGFLHIGNLRTALFGYLLAKSQKGDFILRIEDTDEKREVEGAVESLIKILDWVDIKFDEGPHLGGPCAPYIQTERLAIYKDYAEKLLTSGGAYRCFCSAERLTTMREEQAAAKLAPRYDRHCRDLSQTESDQRAASGEAFVIRQKMPTEGEIIVYDELRGEIKFKAADLEDHVLIKSNGVPTYQFASVVDDHLMAISHVTRGEEWLPSYPKNYLLYQAFGWEAPKFIHLPLILNKGGGKLSKRQGDVFVEDYKSKGYLPEALINFCVLLGWHPKTDQEIFTLDELIKSFSFEGMGISPAVFDVEKLDYLNGYWIRQKTTKELAELIKPYLSNYLADAQGFKKTDDFLINIAWLEQERLKKLSDITDRVAYLFADKIDYEPALLIWKNLTLKEAQANLIEIKEKLLLISDNDWHKDFIEKNIIEWLKANDKKVGDYLWPLRVSLSGQKNSAGPFEILSVLKKTESLQRIDSAIDKQ